VISLKIRTSRRRAIIIGVFMFTTLILFLNTSQQTHGSEFISSIDDMEFFAIEELENGKTYEITISYDTMFNDFDSGFAVYTHESFKDKYKVLTQDDPGFGFEVANYTATADGDVYLGVWLNDDEYGFVDITVIDTDTLATMTVSDYFQSIWYSLRKLWISLGVFLGISFLILTILFVFIGRTAKKHATKVKDAIAKGIALPRYGRKKDKCPFCNVKLPPESMVQCPYCGAPITE